MWDEGGGRRDVHSLLFYGFLCLVWLHAVVSSIECR